MANIFRGAFSIVLLFVFVRAFPILIEDYNIEMMRDMVTCPNSTFRAQENTKNECINAALKCAQEDLKRAMYACNYTDYCIDDALETIEHRLKKRAQPETNSTECSCEAWPKSPFKDFLNSLESLIYQDNSINCNR